jgi:hypothetical protein
VTSKQTPEQPEWGRLIQARREKQGRSVRHAALMADLSDAYWGQVEKGYVVVHGEYRPVTPSRRALLAICDSLHMTTRETSAVLTAAGHKSYVPGEMKAPRESEVDLTGLSRRDVAMLNALADRFRQPSAAATTPLDDEDPKVLPFAAHGRRTPDPADPDRQQRAQRAHEANPAARKKRTPRDPGPV